MEVAVDPPGAPTLPALADSPPVVHHPFRTGSVPSGLRDAAQRRAAVLHQEGDRMLVLARRRNESIVLPDLGVTVQVVAIRRGTVRLGIVAPPGVPSCAKNWSARRRPAPTDGSPRPAPAEPGLGRHSPERRRWGRRSGAAVHGSSGQACRG